MIPAAIALALPTLIGVAERVFTADKVQPDGSVVKKGDMKRAMVISALEVVWSASGEKLLPDFPGVDEKRLFVRTAEVWIEELLPAVLGPKPATQ